MATKLTIAYDSQINAIRTRVADYLVSKFTGAQFRNVDMGKFIDEVIPVIQASRTQVAALTDAYLSTVISGALGKTIPMQGPIDTSMLRGVAASDVYERPFKEVWTALSEGKTLDQAANMGVLRLGSLIATDLQMAKVQQSQETLSNAGEKVIGYERIPTGDNTCALCMIASTQRYHRADLMPIHPGCNCDIGPIVDTGQQTIYPDRYMETHQAVQYRPPIGPVRRIQRSSAGRQHVRGRTHDSLCVGFYRLFYQLLCLLQVALVLRQTVARW